MASTPITWRNINQDIGIKDALSATIAAQNSMNSSFSALDKVLGQRQDVNQRRVDDDILAKKADYLNQVYRFSRDPDLLLEAKQDTSGEMNTSYNNLGAKTQLEVMDVFDKVLNAGYGNIGADRQGTVDTWNFGRGETQRNLTDVVNALKLQVGSAYGNTERMAAIGQQGEALLARYANDPFAQNLIRSGISEAVSAAEKARQDSLMFTSKLNQAEATTEQIRANAASSIANANATTAGIAGIQEDNRAKAFTNKVAAEERAGSQMRNDNPYAEENGGVFTDKKGVELIDGFKNTEMRASTKTTLKRIIPGLHKQITVNNTNYKVPLELVSQLVTEFAADNTGPFATNWLNGFTSDSARLDALNQEIEKRMVDRGYIAKRDQYNYSSILSPGGSRSGPLKRK